MFSFKSWLNHYWILVECFSVESELLDSGVSQHARFMTLTPTVISVSEMLMDMSGTRYPRGAHAKNQSGGSHGPDWTHSSRRTGSHLDTRVSNLVKGSWKESGTLGNSAQQHQAFPFGPQAVAGKSSHFAGLRGISHYNGEKQRSATAKEIKAISLQPGPC